MGKPTVHDIAKAAGVSLATVDRVLNERPGVRDATARRVKDAVSELGYTRDIYAANLARKKQYRFAFLLPEGTSQFLDTLKAAVAEAASGLAIERSQLVVHQVALDDPVALTRELAELEAGELDGVAVMANETPLVRDAIRRLKARGAAVVALVTDQPKSGRDHFIGIDNLAAGRTAGVLVGKFAGERPGFVAVIVNSTFARDMSERRLGFDEAMARFPHLSPLPSLEGHDDHELTERLTREALARHPDLRAIYCAGAGLRGVTQALSVLPGNARPVVVAHELTPHARTALEVGLIDVIISQNTGHIVRSAIRVLRAQAEQTGVIPSQERIRIEIVLKENLP